MMLGSLPHHNITSKRTLGKTEVDLPSHGTELIQYLTLNHLSVHRILGHVFEFGDRSIKEQ